MGGRRDNGCGPLGRAITFDEKYDSGGMHEGSGGHNPCKVNKATNVLGNKNLRQLMGLEGREGEAHETKWMSH